jgi:uncharacterized RDD family membrane protein YckC
MEEDPFIAKGASKKMEAPLADLGQRFAGALIDGFLSAGVAWGLVFGIRALGFNPLSAFFAGGATETSFAFAGIPVWLLQLALISERGQSVGKILAQTQIVNLDGTVAGAVNGWVYRYLPIHLLGTMPALVKAAGGSSRETRLMLSAIVSVVSLVDIALIFSEGNRCLHDLIAGTKVISLR